MRVCFNLNASLAYKYIQIRVSNASLPMSRKYLKDNGNRYRTRNNPEEPSPGHPSRQARLLNALETITASPSFI